MNSFNPSVFSALAHGLNDYCNFYNVCETDFGKKQGFKFGAHHLFILLTLKNKLDSEVKKIIPVPGAAIYNRTHVNFNFEISKIYFDLSKKCDIINSSLNKLK